MQVLFTRFMSVLGSVFVLSSFAGVTYESAQVELAMPLRGTTEILVSADLQLSDLLIVSGLTDGSCKYEGVPYVSEPCFLTRDETSCEFDLQYLNRPNATTYDYVKGVRVRLEQRADGIYAKALGAFYYLARYGVGTHAFAEVGGGIVNANALYDGSNTGYGIQQLTVTTRLAASRAEALPEGQVTVGPAVDLVLSGAAVSGTVPNDFALNPEGRVVDASLRIVADEPAEFSGAFSGTNVVVSVRTGAATAREASRTTVDEVSRAAVLTTSAQMLFPCTQLDDLTPKTAVMCGNTTGLIADPYFVNRTDDGRLLIEYQQAGNGKDWVKGVLVELSQIGSDVYGRVVQAFYYKWAANRLPGSLSVNDPDDVAAMVASGGKTDQGLNTTGTGLSGYGILNMEATVSRNCIERTTPEGFALPGYGALRTNRAPARALDGAFVEDIMTLSAVPTGDVAKLAPLFVPPAKTVPDGREYQLQFMDDNFVKCIFLRLVNTADNGIMAYLMGSAAFESSKVTVGTDLSSVVPYREKCNYGLSRIDFFLQRETTAPFVDFTGTSGLVKETLVVESGSRVRLRNPESIPVSGVIEVGENARLLLEAQDDIDLSIRKSYSINAARGSEVVCVGRVPDIGPVTIDGGRLTLLSRHEFVHDFGTYLDTIELKNGSVLTGYPPRASNRTRLLVTGEGRSTVECGLFICIGTADGGYMTIDVDDTVPGEAADLEVLGEVYVYGTLNQGGTFRKTGPGTVRMCARYVQDFRAGNRLDEGTWILAADGVWGAKNALTLAGGTLKIEEGVTGNAVPSLELLGSSNLVMEENTTFDLGDSTAIAWSGDAVLNVTKAGTATLRASQLTPEQLRKILINGRRATMKSDGRIVPYSGCILTLR